MDNRCENCINYNNIGFSESTGWCETKNIAVDCDDGCRKHFKRRCCLYCDNSLSCEAPDGSQVFVCFECEGFKGKEIIVEIDECCKNFNG